MIKYVNGRDVSIDDSVKIKCYPGATRQRQTDCFQETWYDHHTGTNGIQNKVNTLQKVRKVITTIKEIGVNNEVQIACSSVITAMIKTSRKKLKESTESWRIYLRVKGLSSLIIILMVHTLIEANYT